MSESRGATPEIAAKGTSRAVLGLLRSEPGIRRVLDIPCGHGTFAARLRDLGYDVVAADVVAHAPANGVQRVAADMNQRLPFADGTLDAVVSIDGIEHIERQFDFAGECARVLRPGGVLVLSTPNVSSLRSRWRWLWTGFHHGRKTPLDERRPNPMHHINMVEFHRLRYMLHRSGLHIASIATNRTKPVAWLYAPLIPFAWLLTRVEFWRERRDPEHGGLCAEVRRQMFSASVLFGEALIVKARRIG